MRSQHLRLFSLAVLMILCYLSFSLYQTKKELEELKAHPFEPHHQHQRRDDAAFFASLQYATMPLCLCLTCTDSASAETMTACRSQDR